MMSTVEDAFPWGAEFKVSFDFTHSKISKDQAISDLDSLSDASGLRLAKVVADPDDFFNSRSLYVFGRSAQQTPQDIDWFKPGMQGRLLPSQELGSASLNGPYVYSGSPDAVRGFLDWADSQGIERHVVAKNPVTVLSQALLETGAWLTFVTCAVLSATMVISWYVLRARARALKALSGAPGLKIAVGDLTSLLAAVGPPTVLGLLVSGAAVALQGKASHLPEFILTASSFILSTPRSQNSVGGHDRHGLSDSDVLRSGRSQQAGSLLDAGGDTALSHGGGRLAPCVCEKRLCQDLGPQSLTSEEAEPDVGGRRQGGNQRQQCQRHY